MKFQKYLNESDFTVDEMIETIKKDCQPFLKNWKRSNTKKFLLSGRMGMISMKSSFFIKKTVRKNRKPLDTPLYIHKFFDDWLFGMFGIRARSNAIFCSFQYETIEFYGTPCMIFPIGKYTTIFSHDVRDLFSIYSNIKHKYHLKSDQSDEDVQKDILGLIEKKLKTVNYRDTFEYTDSEIMLNCKECYFVHYDYADEFLKGLS